MAVCPPSLARPHLERDPAVIYVLDDVLRIIYCNQAWDRFAAENGGPGLERKFQLGSSLMDVIPPPLKAVYEHGYRSALLSRSAWNHDYECSSATVYRAFHQTAYPDPEGEGLVVVNSLTVEHAHTAGERSACLPDQQVHMDSEGIVTMCCYCRRSCRVGQANVWDWVPAYVESPPLLISHGVCATCVAMYYPGIV